MSLLQLEKTLAESLRAVVKIKSTIKVRAITTP